MMKDSRWRLLTMPNLDGFSHMAIDEMLLNEASNEDFLPTLRLYSWSPGCISLGYAQPAGDIDPVRLETFGWDLVRRPTGGRAILHIDELTYAVILPLSHPIATGSLIDSYRRIATALMASLRLLGADPRSDAHYDLPTGASTNTPSCFEVPSNYEITVGGKKLIGSAQARRKRAMLQHGSLPLNGDVTRITNILNTSEGEQVEAANRLASHASTLQEATGATHDWEHAVDAFIRGFKLTFGVDFLREALSDEEWLRAISLRKEKYANPQWTRRV